MDRRQRARHAHYQQLLQPARPPAPAQPSPPPPPSPLPDPVVVLTYRAGVKREHLGENECSIGIVGGGLAMMAFCFRRITDGKLERRTLPVRPGGVEGGAEHAWGLKRVAEGRWRITPSICCLDILPPEVPGGPERRVEVWHPPSCDVVGVPVGESWSVP